MTSHAPDLAFLADRLAIQDVMARYCRGIDRCDEQELRRAFTRDAVLDYGSGSGPFDAVIAQVVADLATMRLTHHSLANSLVEIDGDRARAETYVTAFHVVGPPGEEIEMVVGGRYLDRLVRNDGGWLIAERLYVMDWNRQGQSTMQDSGGMYDMLARRGRRWPDDPSYAWQASPLSQ